MACVTTFAIAQLSRPKSHDTPTEVILNLKMSSGGEYLAAATSYSDLCHLDPETLQIVNRFKAHSKRIVDLEFVQPTSAHKSKKGETRSLGSFGPSILCSVGQDGLVAWWDLRLTCKSPALKIQSNLAEKKNFKISSFIFDCIADLPLTSGHVEPFGSNILATGSEKFNHEVPICFWYPHHKITLYFLFSNHFIFLFQGCETIFSSVGPLDRFPQ